MKSVLVFGAGRSSLYLLEYLQKWCITNTAQLIVCDKDISFVAQHIAEKTAITFQEIDVFDIEKIAIKIQESILVISLLPATIHYHIAKLCLQYGKNLATASYISNEMALLNEEAMAKGLIFLNELGLDPGIDHLSAMQIMDNIKKDGGEITSFESYCGGLVADKCDGDNPWKYKFSWNPRNVILAGQGAPAQYQKNETLKVIPYHQLFNHTDTFQIESYGELEGYPNRDSLKYIELYKLHHIKTMIRGTLRKKGYCSAWQVFISLGLTDDTTQLQFKDNATLQTLLKTYLPASNLELPLLNGTSAQILEELLKVKWRLNNDDKDLVVMLHKIGYIKNGQQKTITSSFVLEGASNTHTAMSKTVGLPLAIGCKLILENKVRTRGVLAPLTPEFYEPILAELAVNGVIFTEVES